MPKKKLKVSKPKVKAKVEIKAKPKVKSAPEGFKTSKLHVVSILKRAGIEASDIRSGIPPVFVYDPVNSEKIEEALKNA